MSLLLSLLFLIAAEPSLGSWTSGLTTRVSQGDSRPTVLHGCMRVRGGADNDEEQEDEEEDVGSDLDVADDDDAATASAADPGGFDALSNPFLGGAGGAGGAEGLGLADLAKTLGDPSMLQDALKELQDPATQARVQAMMDDPEFQKSMQQYIDQITKDPQFAELKRQTEKLLEEPGFMEQMSKAFEQMGGIAALDPTAVEKKE